MSSTGALADLIQLSYRYAAGIDRRQWDLFASCFTDPCWIDVSSFGGRPGSMVSVSEWVDRVRGTNGSFDATQHVMSNHRIVDDGPEGWTVEYELQAQHWFRADTMAELGAVDAGNWCILGGHYTCVAAPGVDGLWRMSRLRLDVRWHTGNPGVFELARSRRH